jgi:hypothetical protein
MTVVLAISLATSALPLVIDHPYGLNSALYNHDRWIRPRRNPDKIEMRNASYSRSGPPARGFLDSKFDKRSKTLTETDLVVLMLPRREKLG